MTTSTTTKSNIGTKLALQIIEEGKKPMSPAQIKTKYCLEFPFTVERVVSPSKVFINQCRHKATGKIGELITFYRLDCISGGYSYSELCDCVKWNGNAESLNVDRDSARFVLTDRV